MTNIRYGDFHIHTTASDGVYTSEEVVRAAKEMGLSAISVTDHDTTAGVEKAKEAGATEGIKVVTGIELSSFSNVEIHILGYGFDMLNMDFVQKVEKAKMFRASRNALILEKLKKLNVILEGNYDGTRGRSHIADEMLAKGYVKSKNEAFDRYIGVHGAAYISAERLKPFEAVKMIKDAGGIPVIAHPKRFCTERTIMLLVEGLMPYGLKGIEVHYPTHTPADIAYLQGLCNRFGLIPTGGSDFHNLEHNYSLSKVEITDNLSRAFKI